MTPEMATKLVTLTTIITQLEFKFPPRMIPTMAWIPKGITKLKIPEIIEYM
jgi:hypothetical protein